MRAEISKTRLLSEFVRKVETLSGENLFSCYQCGKCSAGCPMAFAMDLLPNQVIRLIQLGLQEDLARSKSIWLCASCTTCSARCPRGVDLARVMEAVREIVLRNREDYVELAEISREAIEALPQMALVSSLRKHTG